MLVILSYKFRPLKFNDKEIHDWLILAVNLGIKFND